MKVIDGRTIIDDTVMISAEDIRALARTSIIFSEFSKKLNTIADHLMIQLCRKNELEKQNE